MRPTTVLNVERLEERAVPATFGHPWADASHITLSFVPDGADINGTPSNLSASLSPLGGSVAQQTILRAYQTWAANANINIGLVGDSGAAWDAAGMVQADSRFGDIRIGGRALAGDVGALTTPFNYFNTQSGNTMLNTASAFSIGGAAGTLDLYTVALHEAGHSLGIGDNDDTSSIEYRYYQGAWTGLSAGDVSAIQTLYAARQPEAVGNDTLATATPYAGALTADLATATDVDDYRFTPAGGGVPTVVRLKATGLSMVEAKVQVLDQFGQLVAQGAAPDMLNNDVTLTLPSLQPLATYYVRVSSNTADVFGVGSYRLTIDGTAAGTGSGPATGPIQVSGAHTTFATAAPLPQTVQTVSPQLDYYAQVTPSALSSVTYTRVHSPAPTSNQSVFMVVSVYDLGALENAQVSVFDAAHNPLAVKVLSAATGSSVVQVDNVQGNADFFISVNATSNFKYSVDFTTRVIPFDLGSTGSVVSGVAQTATLNVSQSQVLYFLLSASGDNGAGVTMTVRDAAGHIVSVLTTYGGGNRSASVFLAAAQYQVEISLIPNPLAPNSVLAYSLAAAGITDPVGLAVSDPTQTPQGSPPPPPPSDAGALVYWTATDPAQGSLWF
jgi:predicted Zn-dependent protease